jgi:hypothetical protein
LELWQGIVPPLVAQQVALILIEYWLHTLPFSKGQLIVGVIGCREIMNFLINCFNPQRDKS